MNSKHPPAADVMERTWYKFKVRQRVHYYSEGRASKKDHWPVDRPGRCEAAW